MKRHTISLLLLLAASLGLHSCDNLSASQRKQLASVARQVVSEALADDDASTTADDNDATDTGRKTRKTANSTAYEATDALEVPAASTHVKEQLLQRAGYTVSYNADRRVPNWVAWCLTSAHTQGKSKRGGIEFQDDSDVPAPRASTSDYTSSGYDRGHMCPAGDNKWSDEAMRQSFLMTNICPQAPTLNRGDWNEMEQACRRWAKREGRLYIVCGPIYYNQKHKTIGRNKVQVPEAFFKVVLSMGKKPKAIGFIYKNDDGNRPMGDYVNTVDQVERITGYDFFPALPDDVESQVESQCDLSDWR